MSTYLALAAGRDWGKSRRRWREPWSLSHVVEARSKGRSSPKVSGHKRAHVILQRLDSQVSDRIYGGLFSHDEAFYREALQRPPGRDDDPRGRSWNCPGRQEEAP